MLLKDCRVVLLAGCLAAIPALGADDVSCRVDDEPQSADERSREILLIYNHGSDGTIRRFNCFRRPPAWLTRVASSRVGGKRVLVHRPCIRTDTDTVGETLCARGVCKRAASIQAVVRNCIARGYDSRNIFLAGHSAGAWASLLVERANPGLVNGVIVTAPAFDGKREERLCDTPACDRADQRERASMRLQHDRWLADDDGQSPGMSALVLAFHCDPFGYPGEFSFRQNPGVRFDVFPPDLPNPPVAGRECRANAQTRYRLVDGSGATEEAVVCDKISRRQRQAPAAPGEPAQCSEKRVANCPEEMVDSCDMKQHKEAYSSKSVEYWFAPRVIDFIGFRLQAVRDEAQPAAELNDPCRFARYPASCG